VKIENAAVAADQPMVVAWHLTRAALPANLHHGLGQRCEGPNIHATPKWLHRFPRVSGLRAARGFLDAGLSSRSDDDRSGKLACRRVEQLRADMASGEAERVARAARQWLAVLPQLGPRPRLNPVCRSNLAVPEWRDKVRLERTQRPR
jgi:hypothetical protein